MTMQPFWKPPRFQQLFLNPHDYQSSGAACRKEGKKGKRTPLHSNLSRMFVHKQHNAKVNSMFNYFPWIWAAGKVAPSVSCPSGAVARSAGLVRDAEATHRMAWPVQSQRGLLSLLGSGLYIHFPLGKLLSHHTEIVLRRCIGWYSLNSSFPHYDFSRGEFPVGKHPRQLQIVCLSLVVTYTPVLMLLLW